MALRCENLTRLPPIQRGDTWRAVPLVYRDPITLRTPDSSIASMRALFKQDPASSSPPDLEITSGGGGIVIDDAADWEFTVAALASTVTEDMRTGLLYFDIEATDAAGAVTTVMRGTVEVRGDISY